MTIELNALPKFCILSLVSILKFIRRHCTNRSVKSTTTVADNKFSKKGG